MSKQVNLKVSFDFGQACLLSLEIEFEIIQQLSFCVAQTLRRRKEILAFFILHISLYVDLGIKCISVCSLICEKIFCLSFPSVVKIFIS